MSTLSSASSAAPRSTAPDSLADSFATSYAGVVAFIAVAAPS